MNISSPILQGSSGGSVVKNPPAMQETACSAGDPGLMPGLERSPGEGDGSDFSIFAWEIPWTEEPGEVQSMGLQKSLTRLSTHY